MPLIRQKKSLTVHRGDHLADPLGAIFLDPSEERQDAIIDRLRDYLGERVRVLRAEVGRERMTVDVEWSGMSEEAARMSEAARRLSRAGARRGALAMMRDALELDPLNPAVLIGLGEALDANGMPEEALAILKRARESGGDSAELMFTMANLCTRLERTASAIAYLERALELAPDSMRVRSGLMALGRRPPPVKSPELRPAHSRPHRAGRAPSSATPRR